jgi:glycosyltransferase involved in cell wall biosynthesis
VADEIVIVDSFSTDQTKPIATANGARVIEHRFDGLHCSKDFAVQQAKFDHILSLDADEYLSENLQKSLVKTKSNWKAEGYAMNRLNSYAGKWIRSCGWYPDRKIRLLTGNVEGGKETLYTSCRDG